MSQELDTLQAENRKDHVWSTEAFTALTEPGTLWAKKKGLIQPEDLSGVEKVQLGKVFEEPIMRAFAARHGMNYKAADYPMYHPQAPLASHFDFISADGRTLYEIKNLGVGQKKHYGDDGSDHIHPRYRAQTLHEAACHGLRDVVLVVCFGGETIQHFPMHYTDEEVDLHVKAMAKFWATVVEDIKPDNLPEEAIRAMFPVSRAASVVATQQVVKACRVLDEIKTQMKRLEGDKDDPAPGTEIWCRKLIVSYMGKNDTLMDVDGSVLATFKSAKGSKKFNMDRFKQENPSLYEMYLDEVSGSRRFLLK